jgi:hypothetical protein
LGKESRGKERLAAADRASRRQDFPRRLGGSLVSARVSTRSRRCKQGPSVLSNGCKAAA